jgi:ABC-2 type transport system permease protein
MNYLQQIKTVTIWEFQRFYKPKNELLGIVIMLVIFSLSFFGMRALLADGNEKPALALHENADVLLAEMLSEVYDVSIISDPEAEELLKQFESGKPGMLLSPAEESFTLMAWKKPKDVEKLNQVLTVYNQTITAAGLELSETELIRLLNPVSVLGQYFHEAGKGSRVMAFFFAGLMVLAIFLSFAYQFTAITGEKQLRITEQIVSAIKPQVWMDGKIFGITLTGLMSMLTYTVISILGGMLFFQFTNVPFVTISNYIHLPSIALFLVFSLMGILIWNAVLAAIASVITDPNNSAKSSLMMLPILFVLASFLVLRDPDSSMALFLSFFPLTSATALPMRWVVTDMLWWHLPVSFLLLCCTFYVFRRLAAKIFRVSILMSGKEPSWAEVWKMAREQ